MSLNKILITGGAGFIGSQFGIYLKKNGYDVTILDNLSDGYIDNIKSEGKVDFKFILSDIREPLNLDIFEDIDIVFHFAAVSSLPKCQENPFEAYENNVSGLANILEFSRLAKIKRFVFSSTSAVYENNFDLPFCENDSVEPNLIYSSTKLSGEELCKAYASAYGMNIIIARFFNVYGEHQDIHRSMPPFISYLAKEVFFRRTPIVFNSSDVKRDYIYIEDVISCLHKMMLSEKHFTGDIFNICSGKGYSVPDIIEAFSEIAGLKILPKFESPYKYWDKFPKLFEGFFLSKERIAKEVHKNSIGNPLKTYQTFGFKAKVPLQDGLKRVHDYSLVQLSKKCN